VKSLPKAKNGPTWEAVLSYIEQGYAIVGIDEVGRGAWAGPVVAGAVVLPPHLALAGVNDSKLLRTTMREQLNRTIRNQARAIGLGWVASDEVDTHGLSWAVRESGLRALAACGLNATRPYIVILDGKHNYLQDLHPSETIVRADSLVMPVAAASVVAKVARDRYMAALSRRHPGYGFERHVGYGTAAHRTALAQLGVSPIHRTSYAPIKEYLP
jgi:ribonuclease HII